MRLARHLRAEAVAVVLERPRDEGAEAARLVLQLADPAHVLDPLGERLDVAVHHRRRRRHARAGGRGASRPATRSSSSSSAR